MPRRPGSGAGNPLAIPAFMGGGGRSGGGGQPQSWTDSLPRRDFYSGSGNTGSLPRRDKAGLGRGPEVGGPGPSGPHPAFMMLPNGTLTTRGGRGREHSLGRIEAGQFGGPQNGPGILPKGQY